MNFATWSLRNPVPAILICVALALGGLAAFHALTLKNMPDFQTGQFAVDLALPGASPEQLENEVAHPVEDALSALPNVKFVRCIITTGLVHVRMDFEYGGNSDQELAQIKNTLDQIRNLLPSALEPPQTRPLSLAAGSPTITYAVTSDTLDEAALTWFVKETAMRDMAALKAAGEVDMIGGVVREIEVELDPVRLAALNLTAVDVSQAVKSIQVDSSGGHGYVGGAEQGMRLVTSAKSAEDLAALPLILPNGQQVRLDSVARITDAVADRTSSARYDGAPAVGFQVLHNVGADEVALIEQVKAHVASLQAANPQVKFSLVSSMREDIFTEYNRSLHMLLEGAFLTIAVVWLFLKSWRATLVAALALPLSILPAFLALYVAGFTLNTTTMLAITIVVGILVDDAIVEIENISKHMAQGLQVLEATTQAVSEISLAVLATTLSLVVVFLPLSFMTGFTGLILRQFGWTAGAAVLASFLVARLITPLAAIAWLKAPVAHAARFGGPGARIFTLYTRLVRACVDYRWVTLGVAALTFAGALWLYPKLPSDFVPEEDRSYSDVTVELPPGSTLADTLLLSEVTRKAIMAGDHPVAGVQHVFAEVGRFAAEEHGGTWSPAVRTSDLTLTLAPFGKRPSEDAVENEVRLRVSHIPGAKFAVNGAGFGSKVSVTLAGSNPVTLAATASALVTEMAGIQGLSGISSGAGLERTDVIITPDLVKAAALGVKAQDIADVARIATTGDYASATPKLNLDTHQVDIRVRLSPEDASSLDTLASLRVPGRDHPVPLSAVASLSLESSPLELERYNRERHVTITADLGGMALGEALAKVAKLPTMQALPSDVHGTREDEAGLMDQLSDNFTQALILAALCVYLVLAVLFKNFLQPLVILCAAPLSAVGALVGLWLIGGSLGLPAFIGFVMLLGIVSKNSILLVDHALQGIRAEGKNAKAAILAAAEDRARPIIMTSLAMIAGMLPLVLGFAKGDSFSPPMAATIIGGLVSSTLLSLLVVPAVFVIITRLSQGLLRR